MGPTSFGRRSYVGDTLGFEADLDNRQVHPKSPFNRSSYLKPALFLTLAPVFEISPVLNLELFVTITRTIICTLPRSIILPRSLLITVTCKRNLTINLTRGLCQSQSMANSQNPWVLV